MASKRVLFDTNIIIHREASKVINKDIGQLFYWVDKLKFEKCIHPISVEELEKYADKAVVNSFSVKLQSYTLLKTIAPFDGAILEISNKYDRNDNDRQDSKILNEVIKGRVDLLITEDKGIHSKARLTGAEEKVFSIESFLERVFAENPGFLNYKVPSVKKSYIGNVNLADAFFDSFREDYLGFDNWFSKKSDELCYVCEADGEVGAFLFFKIEGIDEPYHDITPSFAPKLRMKIGTLKVAWTGLKLGERLLKIVFDHALLYRVQEIYVTIFNKRPEQQRLIDLLEVFGFHYYGVKVSQSGEELVYLRNFTKEIDLRNPLHYFPFASKLRSRIWFVAIYPEYHTELFPDSILNNEKPIEFIELQPYRNAIRKAYVCHAYERSMRSGDLLVFYRTGGTHKGVVTTIGMVESVVNPIASLEQLVAVCRNKSVLSKSELDKYWSRFPSLKPFVINFLYCYSLPRRPTLSTLVDLGIFASVLSIPRGISNLSETHFSLILKAANSDESFIVD